VPALVVVGDRDPFVPVPQAWQLARQLPDARLAVIPGSGHAAMASQPAIFNAACTAFWRSTQSIAAARAGRVIARDPGAVAR
jgi:pimeloyl-ACP methyl ester carboxylesterase